MMKSRKIPTRIRHRPSARASVMDPANARDINSAIRRALHTKRSGKPTVARIVVVHDDVVDRQSISRVLAACGHRVESVGNSKEALACLEARPTDVVITGITMPEASGLVVLATHRPRLPDVKFIVLVDPDEPSSNLEAAELFGADRVLVRPVDPGDLQAAVRDLLDPQ